MSAATPSPTQLANGFDEHVAYAVNSLLARDDECAGASAHACTLGGASTVSSHFAWVHRMYSRALLRTLELDRRAHDLDRREADLARREGSLKRASRKSHHKHKQHTYHDVGDAVVVPK